MTITIETTTYVREVWGALCEAAQEADAHGLTMLKGVAQKFDNLCDELIDQAGDEGTAVSGMLCNAREFGRADFRLEVKARRSELLNA